MRNRLGACIASCLSFSVLLLAVAAAAAPVAAPAAPAVSVPGAVPRVVSFCFDQRSGAYWFGDDPKGVAIARMDAVASASGLAFTYAAMPVEDCQLAVANGRMDGMLGVAFDARLDWVGAFPAEAAESGRRAVYVDGVALVKERDVPGQSVAQVFRELRRPIGVVPGSEALRKIRELRLPIDDRTRNAHALLERVARTPVEAAAMGFGEAALLLRDDQALASRLELVPGLLAERAYHLVFSKQFVEADAALAESIWDALAQNAVE